MASPLSMMNRRARSASKAVGARTLTMMSTPRASRILVSIAVGAASFAVGLIVGLLIAPASGMETRSMVSDRVNGAYDNVRKFVMREKKDTEENIEEIA